MENEFDYYVVESDGSFTSPLLNVNNDVDSGGIRYLRKGIKVSDDTITHLTFGTPIPRKPAMVDFLDMRGRQVFSKKVYDVLKTKEINGLQLLPVVITSRRRQGGKNIMGENIYTDYWIANVYQEYAFLDPKKSKREGEIDEDGRWDMIDSMVLDKDLMSKTPLEDRLIFVTRECISYVLYHQSIVDLIMSVNPQGIVFVPIEKWYNGISCKL
ncbi:hypothetical protein FACS1894158_10440 [Betaproteobacteria bacterium]|nr:hypothetical protein FACS1894158_10440 [Betaproteobacteria bacterium]